MSVPRRFLSLVLALFTLGCAPVPVVTTADIPEGCQRVFHTGTRIPVIDCSGGTTDAERRQAVSDLQRVTPPQVGNEKATHP